MGARESLSCGTEDVNEGLIDIKPFEQVFFGCSYTGTYGENFPALAGVSWKAGWCWGVRECRAKSSLQTAANFFF